MLMRIYTLGLIAFYFILWASCSNWSLYEMLFWEHNGDLKPTIARVAVAFVLLLAAAGSMTLSQRKD